MSMCVFLPSDLRVLNLLPFHCLSIMILCRSYNPVERRSKGGKERSVKGSNKMPNNNHHPPPNPRLHEQILYPDNSSSSIYVSFWTLLELLFSGQLKPAKSAQVQVLSKEVYCPTDPIALWYNLQWSVCCTLPFFFVCSCVTENFIHLCVIIQLADLKISFDLLERERDFYFSKLRDVELLCQTPQVEDLPVSISLETVLLSKVCLSWFPLVTSFTYQPQDVSLPLNSTCEWRLFLSLRLMCMAWNHHACR